VFKKLTCTFDHVGWNTRLEGAIGCRPFPTPVTSSCERDFLFLGFRSAAPAARRRQPECLRGTGAAGCSGRPRRPVGRRRCNQLPSWCCGPSPATPPARLCSVCSPAHRCPVLSATPTLAGADSVIPTSRCSERIRRCARATRRRLLAEAAGRSWILLPGHFGGHAPGRVEMTPRRLSSAKWADLARI